MRTFKFSDKFQSKHEKKTWFININIIVLYRHTVTYGMFLISYQSFSKASKK